MSASGERQPGAAESPGGTAGGAIIGARYRLRSALGAGQTSLVYLADDLHVAGRQVAIKLAASTGTAAQSDRSDAHLANEARVLAAVRYPAVPRLLDVLARGDRRALVLDYLPGRTLRQMASEAPFAESKVLEWGLRLCDVLAYLHSQRLALTHGAVRAEHCMVLPTGQVALFDFGAAAAATDAGRQHDTRDLAVLLYRLLTGFAQEGDRFPPVRVFAPQVSAATDQALRAALSPPTGKGRVAMVDLRRQLVECCQSLGLGVSICPYCQATVRAQARHCGSCGSTLWREITPRPRRDSSAPQAAPAPPDVPPAPVAPSAAPPAAGSGRSLGREVSGKIGQPRRLTTSYTNRLRGVGRYIDQQGLRRVMIVDSGKSIFIRGQSDGIGRLAGIAPRSVITALLSMEELEELCVAARQHRNQQQAKGRSRSGGLLGSPLFPAGYEDRLRAIGAELDGLMGVSLPTIIETTDCLYLDYNRTDEDLSSGMAHRHLALSGADLERFRAAATARRGRGKGGQSLQAMIQREHPDR